MNYLDLQFPPITITADDLLHLSTIGLSITDAADFLVHEIDRARIIPAHQASPDLVRMGSIVKYRDNISGQAREVTLVYPHDANGKPKSPVSSHDGWRGVDRLVSRSNHRIHNTSG